MRLQPDRLNAEHWAAGNVTMTTLPPGAKTDHLRCTGVMTTRSLGLSLAVFLSACGATDQAGDSRADSDWVLGESPEMDIGGVGRATDSVLMIAAGATRLTSGVVVVVDPYGAAVRYYSPSGELLRSVGRRGDGPGEFRAPWWLRQCGTDSVFVWDAYQGRVTVLNEVGTIVREFHLDGGPAIVSCSRRGTVAAIGDTRRLEVRLRERSAGPLMVLDRAGRILGSFDEVPFYEAQPLGKVTSLAVSDSLIFVGTGDSAFVALYNLEGQQVGGISVGKVSRKPTQQHYDRAIDVAASQVAERSARDRVKAMLRGFFPAPPKSLPPYSALLTSPEGVLWAVTTFPGDTVTVLEAMDANGDRLGSLTIPLDLRVFEVGSGYVLGAYETGDGVPHVVMYRIQPPR